MKLFPSMWSKYHAEKLGIDIGLIRLADKLFGRRKSKRIDFFLLKSGRGFKIIVDNKFCLWFFQDGDHLYYDGWEAGKYNNMDITIFDRLKK